MSDREDIAYILQKLSSLSYVDLILVNSTQYNNIEQLLVETPFLKKNNNNDNDNNNRLNILSSIVYNIFIKVEWKKQIISIIDNNSWLSYNYIQKLNSCINYIPECKQELLNIYKKLSSNQNLIEHRQTHILNNNIYTTCSCGLLYCCILQLFDNINNNKLF